MGGDVSDTRNGSRCEREWLFALAGYGACSPYLGHPQASGHLPRSVGKPGIGTRQGENPAGMETKEVSKWLLCGALSVPPKLTSGLLPEDLPHLVSSPSWEAVLEEGFQLQVVAGGPFSEGSTLP